MGSFSFMKVDIRENKCSDSLTTSANTGLGSILININDISYILLSKLASLHAILTGGRNELGFSGWLMA